MRAIKIKIIVFVLVLSLLMMFFASTSIAIPTYKPMLVGTEWMAICGKPLSASAGAKIFNKGGNAVDAACAMLATECVQNDYLGFGGETQALIYNPNNGKVYGINGLGVAPSGATPEFFLEQGMAFPPNYGPLAAVTPGTPGGLLIMLANFGTMSLKEILEPAIYMAEGYPIMGFVQAYMASENVQEHHAGWKYSKQIFLPPPEVGEIFIQKDLSNTFKKMVIAEQEALAIGKSREDAIQAAYDRFYKGDIAIEYCRGSQEEGGLHTVEDLANWEPYIEDPLMTNYKGIDVYKLQQWVQGPVLLQALNILEDIDLKSMGHNTTEYIHTLYQVMNLAYSDRDFYYGDPYYPPEEPMEGLLSKEYASERRKLIDYEKNDPNIGPGDPYPYQNEENPFKKILEEHYKIYIKSAKTAFVEDDWHMGTTSIQAADAKGWVVSVTPSGGWLPAVIAGKTGIQMSQRMQSFVVDPIMNPYNVVEPGKRPRATLTPSLALKDGRPFMSFSLPGGDFQDQALLQLFLNVVEFDMNVQEACEAPKFRSFQMLGSFGTHSRSPGRVLLDARIPEEVVEELNTMGYDVQIESPGATERPGGEYPGSLTAIYFDHKHGTLLGGAAIQLERYGIAW